MIIVLEMHQYWLLVVLFSIMMTSEGVIYKLNESEYYKMPPLYAMDDYDQCMAHPNGTYCLVDVDLQGGTNSELFWTIQKYSEDKTKHFNHTQIHRGICLTMNCYDFLNNYEINDTDLGEVLEACINNSLYYGYGLKGKISNMQYCNKAKEVLVIDNVEIFMAVVYLVLIVLNVVGTFYDILCSKNDMGNPYLLAFSVPRNWARLTAPSSNTKPKLERLKVFNGMRTITMICVIFSHTSLAISYSYVQNPLFIETAYEDPLKQLLFNGNLVIQTFFIMSSFLLSYNFMIHAEKHSVCWTHLPKGILLRWLRLTPTYALVLATIATWMRHMYRGPLWDLVVTSEALACRQYWWAQILYINNYVYEDTHCMPQTWYLAADTQLFCLGLVVCIVARSWKARVSTLSILLLVALVIVAGHIYFEDLDGVVIQSPEYYRNIYATDPNFRLLYIRGHTNISSCVVGLAAGFLAYHYHGSKTLDKLKKCRWAVWLAFPLGVAIILSGGLFYMDGVQIPMGWRILYAILHKLLFQICVTTVLLGSMFQLESVYRSVVEWRGFTWTGRVSYSAFLLHTLFQRGLVGAQKQPINMSSYYVLIVLAATVIMTYVSGALLWLCVEAPGAAISRALFAPPDIKQNDRDRNTTIEANVISTMDPPRCLTHVLTIPRLRTSRPAAIAQSSSNSPLASAVGEPQAVDYALKSPMTITGRERLHITTAPTSASKSSKSASRRLGGTLDVK